MSFARKVLFLFALGAAGLAPSASAVENSIGFSITFSGDKNVPTVTVRNTSRSAEIKRFELTIGHRDKGFDAVFDFRGDSGVSLLSSYPDTNTGGGSRGDKAILRLNGFTPGRSFTCRVDVDNKGSDSGEDYRYVLFNNEAQPNGAAIAFAVTDPDENSYFEAVSFPDAPSGMDAYTFTGGPQPRILRVKSISEVSGTEYINKVTVKVDGNTVNDVSGRLTADIGPEVSIKVYDDEQVEISAPREVYKNLAGKDITDSVANEPDQIKDKAEERFTAVGISVNDVAQTGDPTLYQFSINNDTRVVVKWQHDYALTVEDFFGDTVSTETDATGQPWAGPLNSEAVGNPDPPVKKTWVKRGDTVIAQVDGQVLDFSRAGLDIRYVPKGYVAGGAANSKASVPDVANARNGSPASLPTTTFNWDNNESSVANLHVGQAPPQRQQVKEFTMHAPATIKYLWQIQYGVRVNVDSPTRAALPKIFQKIGPAFQEVGNLEGVFWFDPGVTLRVGVAANEAGVNSQALTGWISGDGFYFSSSGQINTSDGSLLLGGPSTRSDGSPVANWITSFPDNNGKAYRGLEIPQLQRAARVFWTYGTQAIRTKATIGEYVFQHDDARAAIFTTQPSQLSINSITGANPNVAEAEATVWDPVASKLYPLVPGIFTVKWQPDPNSAETVDVIITAEYPSPAHYPHVADTPPVALDPDPNDNFVFKGIKYRENDAVVDGQNRFTATSPGKAVLLFTELQRVGRGTPREFVRVRVVETKLWNDSLPAPATAVIGKKITDPLDRANLGTGFIRFENARYDAFIYDPAKLEGLASKDVYDLTALRADAPQRIVAHKDRLPGPIIPVNLHPGAAQDQRIVVVWYDDPVKNDEILWPYQARVYIPRWPTAADGLERIVIASQFGSESVDEQGKDQVVAPAIGEAPAETTYNPSRLQQPIVYVQPDPTLPGYNPNEEHALMAPSLRFADVSPRPPAAYALRDNDLNVYNRSNTGFTETRETANSFTSHPFVLVQFFDTADQEFKMRVYKVVKEDVAIPGYKFANRSLITPGANGMVTATPRQLQAEPNVRMEAGEPVIPFYPIGVVVGASPCPETFGTNLKGQSTYWEDHKGSSWAVSGGENAWFSASFYYTMDPSFWWPAGQPGFVKEVLDGTKVVAEARVPETGDCVAFLPRQINSLRTLAPGTKLPVPLVFKVDVDPTPVLYKSDWPANAPVLKAGETLTFQGGEYHADHPTRKIVNASGDVETVETPGLPAVVGFAVGEVVFDSLNPKGEVSKWASQWTARVAQTLDVRGVPLKLADFPSDLQPATKRTRVREGKYVFNDLPASLQRRVRYDPLNGRLQIVGLLNDKEIGNSTLTAAPPAVYVLEPNIITEEERQQLKALTISQAWQDAVDSLAKLSRNPSLVDTDNAKLPNPSDSDYQAKLEAFWRHYYFGVFPKNSAISSSLSLGDFSTVKGLAATDPVPPPISIEAADGSYLVGLEPKTLYSGNGEAVTVTELEPPYDPAKPPKEFPRRVLDPKQAVPMRAFGPGLALIPNPGFLDPDAGLPEISWVTVVENNDPSQAGSPITVHVIQVDRRERYRGAIQTIASDNVFDENLMLRHTGDFGANADQLYFEWWYRPDDGSLNVPPPDLLKPGQPNPWKLFPDPTGNRGRGRYQILLKGNPNAPEALLADTFWFCRYRHLNDDVQGTNWKVPQKDSTGTTLADSVNFIWAGAGNSDPFNDFDADGIPDYRAQLAQGWIKRVLDAVNPYEARIRDFEGDSPSTRVSMISQFGPRFEGPVALNPDKNVIENVGLIELYETILKRGSDLSIDLTRPVSTPAIANALELASTRVSDFYTILGNEAYADAVDPTIGIDDGSVGVDDRAALSSVFAFENQVSSLLEEELALLRGVDDYFARPVYNRLFWNFTKGEGEAAYANNYNISDVNGDGFINEDDAMILYPQGHGDAWGHYLTALRTQYDLLRHPNFNWVSRSEFYNLQDIVIKVDFLDERKFAQTAAAKAKVGAEVVNLTYRQKYVEDPTAQWQGYTDSNKDRGWGVQEWARRAGQGAYFDWITANALLPSEHPNKTLEGIQKVDRKENSDISVISANLNSIQTTFDQANGGQNPLGLAGNVVPFDINPAKIDDLIFGLTYYEQIQERATKAVDNAQSLLETANENRNRIRAVANNETEFRNSVYQQDLAYKNQLISIFGKPYENTIGPGRVYPAGYDGPDLLLFMYVDVRQIDDSTVPGPATSFAKFDADGNLIGGDMYDAFVNGQGSGGAPRADLSDILHIAPELQLYLSDNVRRLFAPTYTRTDGTAGVEVRNGLYSVQYTDLQSPKVPLENLTQFMPVTAAGYTFQAPREWGHRLVSGELQSLINQMIQQEASIATAIGAWDGLQGDIIRTLRLLNAKLDEQANIRLKNEIFTRVKYITEDVIKGIEGAREVIDNLGPPIKDALAAAVEGIPHNLPTAGLAFSPGDALAPVRASLLALHLPEDITLRSASSVLKITKLIAEIAIDVADHELELFEKREEDALAVKEWLVDLENKTGDEPIKRLEIFKEIEALRGLSEQYRAKVDEGTRLIDERAAYNKRVAAQTQRERYQDMTFRVTRNYALQTYRAAFDVAARYTYLAAKAYDYETNFDPKDPGSAQDYFGNAVRARTPGSLSFILSQLGANHEHYKGQLGFSNPQTETGKMSLRTELLRILPKDSTQPDSGLPSPGADSNQLWQDALQNARVSDLWLLPEFRQYCRPFASESDANGQHVPQPGFVFRFGTEIEAGKNFFGQPLSGADHSYDPSHYATKVRSVGVWFSDYLSSSVLDDLPAAPRVYLVPIGTDVMSIPTSSDPNVVRLWKVLDQQIPPPVSASSSALDYGTWIPLLDSLSGGFGQARKFPAFRAYHDGGDEVNTDELVLDSRLVGRSIWNTQWLLIIPGATLNADPSVGMDRFLQQVSDIKLVFQTYGFSGE